VLDTTDVASHDRLEFDSMELHGMTQGKLVVKLNDGWERDLMVLLDK
jgi:hypothetical protein